MFIVILNGGGGHVSANSVQVYRSYKSGGDAKSPPVQGWGAMFFFVVLVALPLQLCQIFLANQAYRIFDAINNKVKIWQWIILIKIQNQFGILICYKIFANFYEMKTFLSIPDF